MFLQPALVAGGLVVGPHGHRGVELQHQPQRLSRPGPQPHAAHGTAAGRHLHARREPRARQVDDHTGRMGQREHPPLRVARQRQRQAGGRRTVATELDAAQLRRRLHRGGCAEPPSQQGGQQGSGQADAAGNRHDNNLRPEPTFFNK